MTTESPKDINDIPEKELVASLNRSVVTSVSMHGEVVYEPGMSEEEEDARTRDVMWRHGEAEDLRPRTERFVEKGYMTPEQAAEHIAHQEKQAAEDRAYVERANAAKAARLASEAPGHSDGPTR